MESILSSLLRATPLAPAPAQSTSSTDVKGKQIEWSLESDDEEDEDFDDGDAGSSRSTKRARISEVIEEETAAADPQQSATPNPDISALIHALNASKTPEAMRVTMDMMNQLRFFSTTNSATNNAGSSSTANVALSTVSPTNPRKSRDKHDKGFRGIALSLQRKMRRLQIPAPPGQIAPKTPASPLTEFLVSSPPNSSSISAPAPTQQAPTSIVEDLASDAILFFGSTSTTTSSAWRQSPRFQGGIMNISLSFEANPPSARVLDGDYSPPCAPELVLHLVGLYFAHVHPYFPMVHKVRFFEQLREKRTDHFNLLVNSMCALMSQQCRDLTAWGVANPVELHMAFFERARVLLGHQFDWPHINNVQALLLLCMVGQGTNINATSYHYIGIAHRLAVELGMHRNLDNLKHASLDPELLECMRTTWFCLYVLDRYTSVVEGRPTAISDEEWDTPFPSSDTPEITHLRHHVGLCELLGRIGNFVNRPSRPGTAHRPHIFPHLASTPPPARDAQCEITTMTANLAAWHAALPPTLAARPPEGSAWSLHHHLHAMFHTASVLLRRLDVSRFDQTCALHACEIGRVLQCLPQHGGVVRGSFVFVLPLVVYSALTASTLFLDLALAAKPLDPKRRRTSSSSGRAAAALAGKVTPDTARMAARELKKSLGAFERLKTTSLFANYYGQLIVEVLRNDAVVLPEDEEDAEDESPSPAGAVQTPRGATTAGLFSFFGGGDGQGQSQQYQHTAGASLTSRIASSMAAVVEGAKWNEFLHFSPKLGQQTMAPATSSATVGSSSSFMSAASQMAPVSFMNAASQMAPTSLINAASQMAPTSLINAASQMAPASLLNAASTMWGRFAAGQVMDQQHPPPPAPMVGHLGPTSPLGRSVLAAEDVQAGMQEGEDGSPGGGHRSPYFNDIFADLLHGSPENSGGVGGEWPEMSLNDLERRPSEPPEDYGQHFQQFQYGSSGMRG
ncbi:fungal-specific transcription factor domain-containing protein [Chytriomyces sp. MP71]|nr:fungal-specific transcription factor domain-containing protein [Chytriomyces sp. MP71]